MADSWGRPARGGVPHRARNYRYGRRNNRPLNEDDRSNNMGSDEGKGKGKRVNLIPRSSRDKGIYGLCFIFLLYWIAERVAAPAWLETTLFLMFVVLAIWTLYKTWRNDRTS